MTKNDIAVQLTDRVPELTKSMAVHVTDAITEILTQAFCRGENIYLRGFGTLEVKATKEKKARDICKGTTVFVPARRTVKFKLSKQLKNRLNNGTVD